MLANAAHIKNVPGRKTDISDAMWISDLLSCGLIKASFVPEQEIQQLRSLLRSKQLTREQTSHVQRIQKTLEEANIKLDSVITDIITDMSRFPTAGHLLAWAGLCPGQNESAGKRKSSRLRKGSPWLKTLMVQCGWAAARKKDSYYKAQFNRLRGRHGPKKAICAVAASMLTAIYHMLKNGTEHQDLGADHFDRRSTTIKAKRLAAQIANLGFEVDIRPLRQAA
jgi:transposase